MKNPLSMFDRREKTASDIPPPATTGRPASVVVLDPKGQWLIDVARGFHAPTVSVPLPEESNWDATPRSRTRVEVNGRKVDPERIIIPVKERDSKFWAAVNWVGEWIRYRRQLKLARVANTTFTHHDVTDKAKHLEMKIGAVAGVCIFAFLGWAIWGLVHAQHTNGFAGAAGTPANYPGEPNFTGHRSFGSPCPYGHRSYSPRREDI
jgi:hypothetical protein